MWQHKTTKEVRAQQRSGLAAKIIANEEYIYIISGSIENAPAHSRIIDNQVLQDRINKLRLRLHVYIYIFND